MYNYPWAVFYRKSLFQEKNYEIPKTLDDLKALAEKMKADGITPFAFADKQGWPAMGTFDNLNMRMNGYDFHISLMAGKESWTDNKVKQVFTTWKDLLPYHQEGALGQPEQRRRAEGHRYLEVHAPAEKGGRDHLFGQEHRPVPRPRHAPGLRLDGHDPLDPAIPEGAGRPGPAVEVHGRPEEVDLHWLEAPSRSRSHSPRARRAGGSAC
jgi:hypothetical protein